MKVQVRFLSTLKSILSKLIKVMGLSSKIKQTNQGQTQNDHILSKQEYELLFSILKDSWIKGADVQVMYSTIYKLQEQYISHYGNQ